MNALIPERVHRLIRSSYDIVAVEPVQCGMSGAKVFHCLSSEGRAFALKRWPPNTKRTRALEVHLVTGQARQHGCDTVPALYGFPHCGEQQPESTRAATLLSADGLWELAQWMPGRQTPSDASLRVVQNGAAAIADFHQSVCSLGTRNQPPPAVLDRLSRIKQLQRQIPDVATAAIDPQFSPKLIHSLHHAQSILRNRWASAASEANQMLLRHVDTTKTTQYVLRDIHREHILLEGDVVTGLIDFDAVRVDVPATDLARWVGSLLVDRQQPEDVWEAALAGYHAQPPSPNHTPARELTDLARDLHKSSVWVNLANWVFWLIAERRQFPAGDEFVAARILQWSKLADQEG